MQWRRMGKRVLRYAQDDNVNVEEKRERSADSSRLTASD
jgi:hypothetical protein